jgi:Transcriptional regulatory protein, C terminal
MAEVRTWQNLPNPFQSAIDSTEVITGHVSGRSRDIAKIINGTQSAILLAGAPNIGKSALMRYLQRPPKAEWSWRKEIESSLDEIDLNNIHFVLVDLTPLEDIVSEDELLNFFIKRCIAALRPLHRSEEEGFTDDLNGLYKLVRFLTRNASTSRYFLMFDSIERLDLPGKKIFEILNLESVAQTPQERSIALLDHCGAIHILIDLLDDFNNFGVIFSIVSLPRPKIGDQFTNVSADLARFTPITLQAFTWSDSLDFLNQQPESFGSRWKSLFEALDGNYIFSDEEQKWLLRQTGTHPYLLQQYCFHTFQFKQDYANIHGEWTELQPTEQRQLIEWINDQLTIFLLRIWKRLHEAVEKSSQETKIKFFDFIHSLVNKSAEEEIDSKIWLNLGLELRYILYSEGIVRYDPLQTIHYPGSTLCQYLLQKVQESNIATTSGFWLNIVRPETPPDQLSLTELEYRLLKILIQHPKRCTEEELMKAAWGKAIERSTFTQRIHHLRKKLKDCCGGTEIIENHYGGHYSLHHSEWFHLK